MSPGAEEHGLEHRWGGSTPDPRSRWTDQENKAQQNKTVLFADYHYCYFGFFFISFSFLRRQYCSPHLLTSTTFTGATDRFISFFFLRGIFFVQVKGYLHSCMFCDLNRCGRFLLPRVLCVIKRLGRWYFFYV